MVRLWPIIAAILLLGWIPAVNACALAAAFPVEFSDRCCEEDAPAAPIFDSCRHCSVLETGFALSGLQPLTLAAPTKRVDEWLTECLTILAKLNAAEAAAIEEWSPPPDRVPLWHFLVRTALPVRGPSRA